MTVPTQTAAESSAAEDMTEREEENDTAPGLVRTGRDSEFHKRERLIERAFDVVVEPLQQWEGGGGGR